MKTCKTCIYWGKEDDYINNHKKSCDNDKISHGSSDDLDSLDAGTDGHDYGIETGPDFGCIHHQEK